MLDPAVQRMFELIRARGATVPQYEQLVFFRADFDTSKEPGPLFYRAANGNGVGINEVANIGIDVGTKDKPYVGYIDAGNTRGIYLDGFDRPGADQPDTDI